MPVAPRLEDFLRGGFWAMGIVGFFLFLSLIGNGVCSLLIILKERMGNSLWKIALSTFVMAMLGVGWLFVREGHGEPMELLGALILSFWAWYFVFIPQLLIFLILKHARTDGKGSRRAKIVWRIALTLFLPIALSSAHWIIGIEVFHITPD